MALPSGVPAVGRFSVRLIGEYFAKCKAAVAGTVMQLISTGDGKDKTLRTTAKVKVTCGADSTLYEVADSGGAVRNFANLDDAVKAVCKETGIEALELNVTVGDIWAETVPTDLVAAAKRTRTSLQAALLKSQTRAATLTSEVALMVGWENEGSIKAARKASAVAALASVNADIASYQAEIASITAAVGE